MPKPSKSKGPGQVRVGIGGWTYEPWRGTFFPAGLPHKRELEYASSVLTTIEINGTFYRTQTPDTFRKWRDETPDDFVFSLKAPRYATNKRVLADAGSSIERFIESGLSELEGKLGPILWQFAATKKFNPDDFAAFLRLLPDNANGLKLRHALELRHPSFVSDEFVAMAKDAGAAIVLADSDDYPRIDAATAGFSYLRLMKTAEEENAGYPETALDAWQNKVGELAKAGDTFVYFISGAKVKAPAAARALLMRLDPKRNLGSDMVQSRA